MNQRIGENIAKLRKVNNMSQNDLAKELNVSNKTISKWECNNTIPDIDMLNKIAKIFNISIDELTNTNIDLKKNSSKNKLKDIIQKLHLSQKKVWIPVLSILFSIILCISCLFLFDKKPEPNNPEPPYISSEVFEIDNKNKTLYSSVSNNTNAVSLIDSLNLRENYTWSLFTDLNCKNEIPSKSVELEIGDNIFYIMLKHENEIDLYSVNIRRRPLYTVSFESKTTDDIQNQLIEEGSCAIIPINTPTKIGYEFSSWKFDFNQPITNDIKIYGNYNPVAYEISVNSSGGVCEIDKLTVKPGENFTLPEPKRDGYLFSGWYYGDYYYSQHITSNIWNYETLEIYASWQSLFKTSSGVITGLGDYLSSLVSEFTIPEKIDNVTITKIEKNAFKEETQIEKIIIPDTVISIGESAFYGCSNLKEVKLSNNITILADNVFEKCTLLSKINIPTNLRQIGNCAFYKCEKLENLILPNTITSIGYLAFCQCASLKTINFPEMLKEIGSSAFDDCYNLEKIELPNLLETIGYDCFSGCSKVEEITIPRGVTTIGRRAFSGCINLNEVSLFCSNATTIDENAFSGCINLTKCNVESIENWLKIKFSENANPCQITKSLYINGVKLTEVVIPNSVTNINDYAFIGCDSLIKITIPNSVTKIGKLAFSDCTLLTEINFDVNCNSYWHEYNYMFQNSGSNSEGITLNIGDNVEIIPNKVFGNYENAPKIKNVVFSENSTCSEIARYAFYGCKSLISLNLPNSLLKIGECAFYACENLTTITIPSKVEEIRSGAFGNAGLIRVIFQTNLNWWIYFTANNPHILYADALKDESAAANYLTNEYAQYDWESTTWLMD